MTPYYQDDAVTLFCGDCREIVPGLGRFDLCLMDPPYGAGYASHPVVGKGKTASNHAAMGWDDCTVELAPFLLACNEAIVWGGNYHALPPRRRWLVWVKRDAPPSLSNCELAWTSYDANARFFDWPIAATNQERVGHPTQKPLALMLWCIALADKAHGTPVQTILDPFCGSGTTGRAAKDLGRKCVMIEREERYCEIAALRLQQDVLPLDQPPAPQPAAEQRQLL